LKRRQRNSNNTVNLVRINPLSPDPDDIRQAAEILGKKGVLVFPTSGLYGLGADARCAEAIRRVFAIKRRPLPTNRCWCCCPAFTILDTVVKMVPDHAEPLLKLWPGGITLIFRAGDHVPAGLTGGTGKIGVRLPAHPVAKALSAQFGGPITATSANLSGCPAAARVTDLDPDVRRKVEMVLDAGELAGGSGSTILDATCWPVKVLREGAVSRRDIEDVLKKG
jgi:L-threonylcarbamoyladenylate synthase